jgi:hypothetical protein
MRYIKNISCILCWNALKNNQKYIDIPEAELVNLKSKGGLPHPNIHLFHFLTKVEESFATHFQYKYVFDLTVDDVLNFPISFPCNEQKS